MDINIAPIKNYEGKEIPINCEVNIAGMPGDDFKILEPVKILGVIRNFGGTFELEAKGTAKLQFVCDRCAEGFSSEMNFNISERFKEIERFSDSEDEENQNSDINYLSGDIISLDEYVYSNMVLNVPIKHLCREDCKGLCFKCGTNLNNGSCSCDTREVDPRFDILNSLDID